VLLAAWSVPAIASAATAYTYGGSTSTSTGWQGILVGDTYCDNNDVYADYKRDTGTPQVLRNSRGCGTGEQTGNNPNNLIYRFNHCTDDAGPNTCSSTVYR
jgi:hypothetical protein